MKRKTDRSRNVFFRKNHIWKSTFREIRQSLGRFMAIFAIVAMGVGFFSGLKVTRAAMVETTREYLEKTAFYDYRILSTLGFEAEDVAFLGEQKDVRAAEGSVTADIIYRTEEGKSGVVKAHTLTEQINQVKVLKGRLPEKADECVVDANLFSEEMLGRQLYLSETNEEEDLEQFAYDAYTIVGIVQSPYYIQYERGNTSLENGRVNGFIYLKPEGFALEYFTEIFVKFNQDFDLYSDAYDAFTEEKESEWEQLAEEAGNRRYERILADGRSEIEDARKELAEESAEAEKELSDAREELADAEKELLDAAEKLADGKAEIADGEKELADGRTEIEENEGKLADARVELADGKKKLTDGEKALSDGWDEWEQQSKSLEEGQELLAQAQAKLDVQKENLVWQEKELEAGENALAEGQKTLDEERMRTEGLVQEQRDALNKKEAALQAAYDMGMLSKEEYDAGMLAITAGRQELEAGYEKAQEEFTAAQTRLDMTAQELAKGRAALEAGKQTIAAYQEELDGQKAQVQAGESALASAYMQLQESETELNHKKQELADAEAELAKGEKELADARTELADGERELADAKKEVEEGEQEYQDGLAEYEDGLQEYQEGLAEFETETADAEAEIDEAQQELADLEEPDTYVLGRDTNVGYVCFENDSAIVDGIANIFPVFFFLVAALVCSTTMNRMVEEQRTQIGVLKALGYSKIVIMSKYLFYAGAAALTGCVAGFFGGTWLFPEVIWSAYGIMYRVDALVYVFSPVLAVISLAAALLCTMGVTYLTCRQELSEVAAELMRPKAPKAGKRVLLEKISFIWSRMSFLKKVSVRNIFRYKKRLFMMVIGIGGCTALIVTGFGIKDSIANIADQQFSEIQTYDLGLTLSENIVEETERKIRSAAGEDLEGMYVLSESTMDLVTDDGRKSVNVVTADSAQDIGDYLNLHTREKEPLSYPGAGETVVTDKIAGQLGIEVGDTVSLQDEEQNTLSVKVSGISRNFVYNYVYIDRATYAEQLKQEPENKSVWMNVRETADVHQTAAAFMHMDEVSNVTVNEDTKERFSSMMSSLDLIVAFIILCAGGLAFIVLYNLTNINITERVREIATIKVLGFYKKETAAYVFRENAVLTLMGTLAGLPLGCLLHRFVMKQIQVDMVAFDTLVTPLSYFLSVVITLAFGWLINRLMRFKLDRVSMTESLKSVD